MERRLDVGNSNSDVTGSGGENELEDRFSSLPDAILIYILTLLPTRDAVRTMAIRRLGLLWTFIDRLDFDKCLYHNCFDEDPDPDDGRCSNFIRHTLNLHARPTIDKFCLKFGFMFSDPMIIRELEETQVAEDYMEDLKLSSEIDIWLCFAVRKKVKLLIINLLECGYADPERSYKLHKLVQSSHYLTELRLFNCELNPTERIRLTSLKTLYLKEILLSDILIDEIEYGCPLLEDLSIIECYGLHELKLTSIRLKKLVICVGMLERSKLEIYCPTVKSVNVSGWLDRLEFKNVSSVVDAEFLIVWVFKCEIMLYPEMRGLFEKLCHARALTVCTWCILVFTIWGFQALPCPSFNWKHLVLRTCLTKWHLPGVASLLRNSPYLESLIIDNDVVFRSLPTEYVKRLEPYDFDETTFWNSLEPLRCLTNQLKTVNIYGSGINPHVIRLVKFLLKSSLVLERIVITTKQDTEPLWKERYLECTEELSSFARASSHAVIVFL